MRKIYAILPLACALTFTACDDYDDTALWEQVNSNTERIAALEEWQETTNNNIAALQQLLNTNDMITSVTPVLQGDKEVGYTITFLHSDPVTIYHGEKGDKGEDGTAGSTPQIGLTQQTDGNWYWTLNGELMTDSKGNPIRANGEDGKDGQDGEDGADGDDGSTGATGRPGTPAPTPQIKLGSTLTSGTYYGLNGNKQTEADKTAWYLSVDNGASWYRVNGEDGQSGSSGDSFFQNVDTSNPDYVTFTLIDGITTFNVPKYQGTMLTFALGGTALTDLKQAIDLADGTLTYAPADAEVSARILEGEGWSASAEDGTITVSSGSLGEEALLEVTLTDNGRVIETYQLKVKQEGLRGAGTKSNPYQVSSPAELVYIAEQVKSGQYYKDDYFQLSQDVDLTGVEWTPIGLYDGGDIDEPFKGTFDGNNCVIKGLKIQKNSDTQLAQGLFGSVFEGEIKNLTLESPVVEAGDYVGAIAGVIWSGKVENCRVIDGTISGNNTVGGIVGTNDGGSISDCSVESTTVTTKGYGGGIAGDLNGDYENAEIATCRFSGTVMTKASSSSIGGIAGYTNNYCFIDASYANCTLQVTTGNEAFTRAGGIVGFLYKSVTACYAIAEVEGKPAAIGGVVGYQVTEGTFGDPVKSEVCTCYWDGASITNGIGGKGKSGNISSNGATNDNAAQVTGSDWSTAMSAMNTALSGTGWQYETSSDDDFPLVIKATN